MTRLKNIHYIHFDSIDSTHTWTKKNSDSLDPNQLTCVTALEQTAGRGRFYRKWISPKGENIYATLYFCLPKDCPYLINLGQVLSLSCIAILKKKGFRPQVKWPNDILLDGKKVAGILCDTVFSKDHLNIVLSIGINVNMGPELLDTIDQPATSLAQLSGQTWSLEQVLNPVLKQFLKDLATLQEKGFEPFRKKYEELLAFKGEEISCHDGMKTIKGICHSINSDGRLNLLLPDGQMTTLSAGELKTK
ncbi:MAG: biotin--[acetyl-CoA-carboxylase] ligase [Candidatus Melainabacteria bacterium]|nr:biotin--[acetyl-CoA-carboxylase] ligase [Candidatus Melainabacteria bacterium]